MKVHKFFAILITVACFSSTIGAQPWECTNGQFQYAPGKWEEFCVYRSVVWKKGTPEPEISTATATKVALVDSTFTRLPDRFFQVFPQLEWLVVTNTSLEELPIKNRMTHVYAVGNNITRLQVDGSATMLTTLSLRNNPFSDLGIIGQRLRALEVLDLSDTEVATSKNNEIQLVSFASLVNLTELYLVKVQAHYVENEEQTTLPKLKVLDLSGNLITPSNFNFRVFRSLPVLEELYLRNCMMGTLFVTDIRQDMSSLKRIFLDGNNFDCNLLQKLLAHLNDRGIVAPGQSNKCQIGYDNLQGLCCKSYDDYYPPVIPQSGPATSTTKESVGTTTSIMSTTSPDSIDEIETKGMDTDGESSTWIIILVVIALFCLAGLITAVVLFKMKVKRHQQVPTVDDVSHEL